MEDNKELLTPQLKEVENKIRQNYKSPNNDFSKLNVEGVSYENDYFYDAPVQTLNNKKTFETRDYNILDAYAPLSDGNYVARYDTYKAGIDNYETNAQNQSTGEKWSNGLQKFAGKTFNSVLGGTIGMVYGIGSGFSEGSFSAVYDNNFSNWLNDLDIKMNNQLANYYTKQEQDLGLFGQAGTANFWSDKVLGGLSFTAGAIISEGIWAAATGGASVIANPLKWSVRGIGKVAVADGIASTKSLLKSALRPTTVRGVNNVGRIADGLNLARFTATSAGYESSVEALQYRKEQEETFYHNFKEMNGRMPSKEEEADFKTNLENSANAVFATNMAIVGSSNLVTMGNIFKIKSPVKIDLFSDVRQSVYGIGKTASELTRLNKISRIALPLVKNMVTEGLYEEGFQSITSNTAGQWLQNTYNEDTVENSFTLSGALYDSFAQQYGTKEGWVENGVGMIIGLLGEGVSGNTRGEVNREIRDYESRQKLQETFTPKVVSEAFLNANRVSSFNKQAEEAQAKGNLTEARIAQDGTIISMLTNRHQLGDSMEEVALDVQAGLNTVTQEQLKGLGINEDLDSWKESQMKAFTSISDSFSSNREFAERVIGRGMTMGLNELEADNKLSPVNEKLNTQEALIQSLTFSMMAGQRANSVMEEASNEMGGILGEETQRTLQVVNRLSTLESGTKKKVANAKVKINALRQKAVSLNKELARVTNIPDSENGNVEKGNKILNLTNQLVATQERLAQEELSATELTNSINLANNALSKTEGLQFNQVADFTNISLEDILKLDENVKKLGDSIDTMKEVSPETASRLEAILSEHNNARRAFKNYQASIKMFQEGTFKLTSVNTKLGKILSKNVKLDDANREWLSGILSDYTGRVVDNLGKEANLQVAQEQEITTDSILDKRRNNATLTPEEQVFYQENKEEINTRLKQEPLPPPTQQVFIDELNKELNDLRSELNNIPEFVETVVTNNGTPQSEIEADIERRRQEDLKKGQLFLMNDGTYGGSRLVSLEEYSAVQIQENNLDSDVTKWDYNTFNDTGIFVNLSLGVAYIVPNNSYNGKKAEVVKVFINKTTKRFDLSNPRIINTPNIELVAKAANIDSKELYNEVLNAITKYDAELKALEEQPTTNTQKTLNPQRQEVQNRINEVEAKIEERRKKAKELGETTKTTLTNSEYLKERIENILSRLDNATIPVDNLQEPPQKPTIQDIQEYKELFARQSFEYLLAVETVRLEELRGMLSAWKVLDSYLDSESGMTLADMTELLAQVEQEVQEAETVKRLDDEDVLASTSDADAFESKTDYSLGQNVLASATVKRNTDGTLTLHHIEPLKILSNSFTVERKGKLIDNPSRIEAGDKVLDSTGLEFIMDNSRNIKLTTDEFNKLGFTIVNSGTVNWSYSDIYEFNGSELVKRASDLLEPGLQPQILAEVENGTQVRFEIDRNDSYTQGLLNTYNKKPTEENRKSLQDGIKIFVIINNKKVSVLKGQRDLALPIFTDIRSEAFKVITEETAVNDLGITTTVKGVFLGSPQLFVSQDGKVETREFTDSSLGKVLATGYIKDGEVTLSNEIAGEVNKTYVGKVSNKNKGKKLPIVIVKRGINFVALPIQLNTYSLTEQEVDEMMGSVYNSTSETEVAKALNLIIQNNSLRQISKILPNQVSDEKVEEVRDALLAMENTISAEQLSSENYDKDSLKSDAQMYIDIDNIEQVIKDFKVRIDLENVRFKQELEFDRNDTKTSLEDELNDLAVELYRDLQTNSTTKYVDKKGNDYEHKYIEVFDEKPIEKSTVNTIKQRNINILREAFSHNPQSSKILKSAITQEKIDRVKNLLKALDKIAQQTKVDSANKKSGEKNTNCK